MMAVPDVLSVGAQAATDLMRISLPSTRCRPHSFDSGFSHHQRPARTSSPGWIGAGAGLAADRRVAAVVQRVVGHVVGADVVPHVLLGPVGQRIELGHAVGRVVFLHGQLGAGARLGAALAGDPGLLAGQGAAQRLDLADAAAFLAHLDAVVEGVQAVLRDVVVDRARAAGDTARCRSRSAP